MPIQYRLDLAARAIHYQNFALTVRCTHLQDVNESIGAVCIGLYGFPVIVAHLAHHFGDAVLQVCCCATAGEYLNLHLFVLSAIGGQA
ncbi:hypothetical protein D3C86_1703310 [compost metagenome]